MKEDLDLGQKIGMWAVVGTFSWLVLLGLFYLTVTVFRHLF